MPIVNRSVNPNPDFDPDSYSKARYGSNCLVNVDGNLYIYGGNTGHGETCRGDLWKLQLAKEWGRHAQGPSGVWQCLYTPHFTKPSEKGKEKGTEKGTESSVTVPEPRGAHTAIGCDGNLLVFGGNGRTMWSQP